MPNDRGIVQGYGRRTIAAKPSLKIASNTRNEPPSAIFEKFEIEPIGLFTDSAMARSKASALKTRCLSARRTCSLYLEVRQISDVSVSYVFRLTAISRMYSYRKDAPHLLCWVAVSSADALLYWIWFLSMISFARKKRQLCVSRACKSTKLRPNYLPSAASFLMETNCITF